MTDTTDNDTQGGSTMTESDDVKLPKHSLLSRLYTGTGAFEIVGRRRVYYAVTVVLLLISVLSIGIRGFSFGIDFEGGTKVEFPAQGATTSQVSDVYHQTFGTDPVSVQTAGSGGSQTIQLRSETLDAAQTIRLQNALFNEFHPTDRNGQATPNAISVSAVSSTWGGEITKKALIALVVFLVIAAIYITIRFERDMAISSLISLFFDMVITAGIYSLVGFEVSPATVIGFLTILGFSLYDTVVVFDKVEENTRGVTHLTRRTYAEQANLAVNQTLMRSINTTLISILPVLGLLVVAVWMLGVGTLKDLALVQLIGIIVGAYSSIFTATPMLVSLKERGREIGAHTKKVLSRRAAAAAKAAGEGAAGQVQGGQVPGSGARTAAVSAGVAPVTVRAAGGTPRPGARPTGKRKKRS
ncbi:protein translocase subunit SecF [Speluncibacter jeojiensis]|uniref:Protein-export membrane protein SecF n=1 Tax=Speluncibacter jeojiensis TaxID=2710754 RepID=A0A9X4RFH1_9ACTN|nr:protein translocase subunit SecF [Corynebacteriales bacterium D3-21]